MLCQGGLGQTSRQLQECGWIIALICAEGGGLVDGLCERGGGGGQHLKA